ncbi:hypothetical protein WN71_029530 [Streptomyces mangrovisoli]|uniref:Uncharacterized protein n=1 Tax=Streptomyces mangrovisoli TaxID=1428628 RepID=A0A1J4NQ85_9ACTN|nr:hypothetical protein WN71_029530 [Streptomyces mangrovisoli]
MHTLLDLGLCQAQFAARQTSPGLAMTDGYPGSPNSSRGKTEGVHLRLVLGGTRHPVAAAAPEVCGTSRTSEERAPAA